MSIALSVGLAAVVAYTAVDFCYTTEDLNNGDITPHELREYIKSSHFLERVGHFSKLAALYFYERGNDCVDVK